MIVGTARDLGVRFVAERIHPPRMPPILIGWGFTVGSVSVTMALLRGNPRAELGVDAVTNASDHTMIMERIGFELDVEIARARQAYRSTMGGANETRRAYDRYVRAIRAADAFAHPKSPF